MVDITALTKELNKSGISTGICNPDYWISTGNYALNYIMSGNCGVGIPNRKTVMLWGESGTGKSFLASSMAKQAQDNGYFVIYLDSEHAIHEEYLLKIGMNLDAEHFLPVTLSTMEEAVKTLSILLKGLPPEQKVCFVLDSLTNLHLEKDTDEFDKGELKGDMGQFAKKAKKFISNLNTKIGDRDAFFVFTVHAYLNQDVTNGEGRHIPSGGKGIIFLPSISIYLNKLQLKEGTDIVGVRIKAKIVKTRFTQPNQTIELSVPYTEGIDPVDGLVDILVKNGIIEKNGAWYTLDGNKYQITKLNDHLREHTAEIIARMNTSEPVEYTDSDSTIVDD